MSDAAILQLLFWWSILVNPLIGWLLGLYANRPLAGFMYGWCLGPIGWALVLLFGDYTERNRRREDKILAQRYLADQYRMRSSSPQPPPRPEPPIVLSPED